MLVVQTVGCRSVPNRCEISGWQFILNQLYEFAPRVASLAIQLLIFNGILKAGFYSQQDMEGTLEETMVMNMYCHFATGVGEPKYMPVQSWGSLNKTLLEALDSYNEVNPALNLVLFEDAMSHM